MPTSDIKKGPLYVDSTNNRVGIGTSSPSEALEVHGTTPILQINDRGLYQAQFGLIGNDLEIRGSSGNVEFYTGSADGASSTERLRIDSSGNVGIGTVSPTCELEVTNGSSRGKIRLSGTTGGIFESWDGTNGIYFGSHSAVLGSGSSADGVVFVESNRDITLQTGGIERFRLDGSSGNVGIAQSSPAATSSTYKNLQVGLAGVVTGRTDDSPLYLSSNLSYNSGWKYIANTTATQIALGTNIQFFNAPSGTAGTAATLTERMRINSSGFLRCVGVYNQSAADSANVVVDASGNVYRSTSALKYKQDIRDIEEIDISQFRPIRYKSNLNRDDQTKDHFGFIADEAHNAGYTELVSYGAVNEETGIAEVEGFRYDRMTVLLTKVVQQQQETITALEARIAALEAN